MPQPAPASTTLNALESAAEEHELSTLKVAAETREVAFADKRTVEQGAS